MPRCTSPGPGGYRCAGQLSHCLTSHQEGNGTWPLYGAERTALAIVERLQLQGPERVCTYAATLEQLNREEEARDATGPAGIAADRDALSGLLGALARAEQRGTFAPADVRAAAGRARRHLDRVQRQDAERAELAARHAAEWAAFEAGE